MRSGRRANRSSYIGENTDRSRRDGAHPAGHRGNSSAPVAIDEACCAEGAKVGPLPGAVVARGWATTAGTRAAGLPTPAPQAIAATPTSARTATAARAAESRRQENPFCRRHAS